MDRIRPEPLFIFGGISQYLGAAIAVVLFDHFTPGAVAFLRVIAAAAIIIVVRRSWKRSWDGRTLRLAAAFGVTLAAMNLSFYLAIDRLPIGNAVAIEFLGPVAVAALGARRLRNGLALAVALSGVVLLAGVQPEGTRLGVVFALLAAVLWAGYILLGHQVAKDGGGVDGLGVGMAIGALAIAPFGVGDLGSLDGRWWLLLVALSTGLLSNAIPYGIDQVVMRRLPRGRFAFLLALWPMTAALVGFVTLRQVPSLPELAGIGMVAVAILVAGGDAGW